MVIRDLFFSAEVSNKKRKLLNIAGVSDRFTAAVFDFFILSPVVSLLLAGLLREIKTYLILDSHSPEANVIWLIFVSSGIFCAVFLQSLFLYYWGATPGQRFLHLQVVPYPQEDARLTFSQCLIRSTFGLANFLFLGLPFLEVLSHPLRRAFHERASDTIVITLREKFQHRPLAIERRFVGMWLKLSFCFFAIAGVLFAAREYVDAKHGLFAKTADVQKLYCSELSPAEDDETSSERLDRALALFVADEISGECLEKEADRALWDVSDDNKTWAYLAKGMTGEDAKVQSEYFDKVCERKKGGEACAIARYLETDRKKAEFNFTNPQSVSGKVLALDQLMETKDFSGALTSLKKLRELSFLSTHWERNFVRAVWSTQNSSVQRSERRPASVDSEKSAGPVESEAFKEFKEKYGVE